MREDAQAAEVSRKEEVDFIQKKLERLDPDKSRPHVEAFELKFREF